MRSCSTHLKKSKLLPRARTSASSSPTQLALMMLLFSATDMPLPRVRPCFWKGWEVGNGGGFCCLVWIGGALLLGGGAAQAAGRSAAAGG